MSLILSLKKLYNEKFHDRPGQINSHDVFWNQSLNKPLGPPDLNRDQKKKLWEPMGTGSQPEKKWYHWVPGTDQISSHADFCSIL